MLDIASLKAPHNPQVRHAPPPSCCCVVASPRVAALPGHQVNFTRAEVLESFAMRADQVSS
jgi:hypothetical protein